MAAQEMVKCPKCDVFRKSNFCPDCGSRIPRKDKYTAETLYKWICTRLEKETSVRAREKWEGWKKALNSLMDDAGWNH